MIHSICQRLSGWIAENKLLTFLSICLFAFVIATIALASEKQGLEADLAKCRNESKVT